MKEYRLSEDERTYIYKLLKRQMRNSKHWSECPVLDYLLNCREQFRFCIFAKEKEQQIAKAFIKRKENKNGSLL